MRAGGVIGGGAGGAHVFARDAREVAGAAFSGHLALERALATQHSLHLHGRAGGKLRNPRGAGGLGLPHQVDLAARPVPHVEQQATGRPEGDRHHEQHDKPQHASFYPHPLVSRPGRRRQCVSQRSTRGTATGVLEAVGTSAASTIPKALGSTVRRGDGIRSDPPVTVSRVGPVLRAAGQGACCRQQAPQRGLAGESGEDFADVAGLDYVERSLEVAAARLHNVVTLFPNATDLRRYGSPLRGAGRCGRGICVGAIPADL